MSATLGTIHVMKLKAQGVKGFTPENLSVNQRRKVESNLSLQNLTDLLRNDPVMGKMKRSEINNGIILQSRTSWKSWGENITITVQPKHANLNEYQIVSKPRLSTTIIDWGKNFENVTRIQNLFTSKDKLIQG